jgi:serine/threonine protein kinase
MPFSAADRLGPYEIVSPIGAGGMGEVYKARDSRLDRTVALKVSRAEFTERFSREAKTVAQLNHPHICTLHDVGSNYLVMEFVDGTPLQGPLPLAKALEYAGQILDALDGPRRRPPQRHSPSRSETRQHSGHEAGDQVAGFRSG